MNTSWGLRSRVTVAFALLALMVSVLLGTLTYVLVRNFLVDEQERLASRRALLDANRVASALAGGRDDYAAILQELPVGDASPLLRTGGEWFGSVSVAPEQIPDSLLQVALDDGAAIQKFRVTGAPFLGTASRLEGALYVELVRLDSLEGTLNTVALSAAGAAGAVSLLGGFIGFRAGQRIMRPLRTLSDTAERITRGEQHVRMPDTDDPDLASITDGFNDMSAAVEERIERERRFAANVSHELRSPITAMMGTVDLIEPSLDSLPERDARLVGVLCGSVRRFNQVVLDLLEVSKVTAAPDLQVAEADIRDAVLNLLQSRAIPDRLVDGPEVRVFTDVRHLRRVIANLLDNARKHGEGVVRVVVDAHSGGARIYVDDAGPGIDPDDVARLFEPFNRGRGSERTDGAGLGLAIARTHAAAISGSLEVLRSPEGGARMQLSIPSLPPPELPADADWPAAEGDPQ